MTVKDLIARLKKMPKDATVVVRKGNNDGCDSCGYGESYSEIDIVDCYDLATRVELVTS